jgi:RNA polymerase primary sigma factor
MTSHNPLFDLANPDVAAALMLARRKGSMPIDVLNSLLPSEETTPEEIEAALLMLSQMEICLVESD